MGWLMREPQLLVWLSTLYRLKAAEKGRLVKAFFVYSLERNTIFLVT